MSRKQINWIRKTVLLTLAVALALTWSQSGWTKAGCVVERGLDPLDVLNTGVRHNVWIVLDTSGSMNDPFAGSSTKLAAAKNVLNLIMDELQDAQGNPLVNWGFVRFLNNTSNSTRCVNQFTNSCVGLNLNELQNPPGCGDQDNRADIKAVLGRATAAGWTPNGISMDQLSKEITAISDPTDYNFVANLLPNQRNFFIIVTDGDDTCECDTKLWDAASPAYLRSRDGVPTPTQPVSTTADRQAYNAGLKGKLAYERLNPTATDRENGALGGAFVIGMGLSSASRARANHLAWEASGAAYGNPNALSALFADNTDQLLKSLRDVLARIGIPKTEVILGSPVVGSVKELIPEIPDLFIQDPETSALRRVTAADVLGDVTTPDLVDVRFARRLRASLKNNVLFSTSVETPGFRGHLRASNIYTVSDYGTGAETRPGDTRSDDVKLFWDAGVVLQERLPDDRTILFNRRNDPPGTPARELLLAEESGPYSNDQLADILGVGQSYLRDIDPAEVGARTKADAARIVVKVLRGYRLVADPVNGFYNAAGELNFSILDKDGNRTWKLYDPTNVGPAVVQNPPRSPDADPPINHADEYGVLFPEGFYWDYFNRQTVVYLGTNGGMLHAFRADNGAELYAYVPADALGDYAVGETPGSRNTLKDLVELIVADNNGIANHKFFVASSASVEDVYLNAPAGDDAWHTLLAFGRGKEGKFITALDITGIGDWDGDPLNVNDRLNANVVTRLPKLRFNVGNRDGIVDSDAFGGSYDGLGETWSVPVMGNVRANAPLDDQWVLFVGGGYGCQQNNEGQYLYVLRMEDGSIYGRFLAENDPGAPIDYNGLVATPALYNPHFADPTLQDERDYTSRVYIGDLQGRVYKLDCYTPGAWTFEVFYEIGLNQPITAQAALYQPLGNQQVHVILGTGGDQRVDAEANTFQVVALLDPALQEGANDPGTLVWSVEIAAGERVSVAPVALGNAVFVAASRSDFEIGDCVWRFYSTLYGLDIESGLGVFDLDIDTVGYDNPLDLGEGKVTGLFGRDEHLYVSKSGSISLRGETLIMGRDTWKPPDPAGPSGTIQVLVRGFRLSPF